MASSSKPDKPIAKARSGRANNKHAKGHGKGRPQTYKPEFAKRAYSYILLKGYETTDVQIANYLNVTVKTLEGWKRRYQDFRGALVRGREADQGVAVSMYRRAVGYKHKSEEIFYDSRSKCGVCKGTGEDEYGNLCEECKGRGQGVAIRVPVIKKYPPDTKAALSILRRQHKSWQQTRAIEFSGPDGKPVEVNLDSIDVEDLTPETLEMIARDVRERVRKKREEKE